MLTSPWFRWNDALIAASKNAPPMRKGYVGYAARIIQLALIELGYSMPRTVAKYGSPDGIYGAETKSKVISFQKKHGLSKDGVVGKNTIAKMDQLVRTAWNPPPEIEGPGNARRSDENARIAVLNTLRGSRPQSINFVFKGVVIRGVDYLRIGEAVYDDVIAVEVGHVPGGMGVYFSKQNVLRLAFFMANSFKRKSTIVHELTHAIIDQRSLRMSTIKSESIAWIAQCLYLRLCGIEQLNPGYGGKAQKVYESANRLAGEWRTSHRFSSENIEALEKALREIPHYNHNHDFEGDGI